MGPVLRQCKKKKIKQLFRLVGGLMMAGKLGNDLTLPGNVLFALTNMPQHHVDFGFAYHSILGHF
jgi:hypothetical protein